MDEEQVAVVQCLCTSRQFDHPEIWRNRLGADHFKAACAADEWGCQRAERKGQRHGIHRKFRVEQCRAFTENASAEPLIMRVIPGGEPTGKKVLIIDDDPTISALMQRQLVKNGYAVLIARSGKEGLSMAKTHQPDVITLDILMPEIDGWSTLRALKADPESRHIPVIMASILDEKNKGFALGAADFLSKPIERDYLISSVQRLIGQKKPQPSRNRR